MSCPVDAFASVVFGSLLQVDSLPVALDRAVHFTSIVIRATFGHRYPFRDGVLPERVLDNLKGPVAISSYELPGRVLVYGPVWAVSCGVNKL